ncbi:MAG: hypothetical protein D6679_01330 [Candidatus Hydrogenedentota bacterium]|nr:MAG: hypothetical protein D6679_01330 [Candidatus Hydrogenedentota bacterium]
MAPLGTTERGGATKIAGISYLNARPFFYPLFRKKVPHNFTIELMTPAEANKALWEGTADAGLISTAAFFRMQRRASRGQGEGAVRISGLEIAAAGRVGSIRLFCTDSLEKLERIYVTSETATSFSMLKILLRRLRLRPTFVWSSDPLGKLSASEDRGEGALLIGDAALRKRKGFAHIYDLGELWWQEFRLPMVYAVMAVREAVEEKKGILAKTFQQCLKWSRRHSSELLDEVSSDEWLIPAQEYLDIFERSRKDLKLEEGLEVFRREWETAEDTE